MIVSLDISDCLFDVYPQVDFVWLPQRVTLGTTEMKRRLLARIIPWEGIKKSSSIICIFPFI